MTNFPTEYDYLTDFNNWLASEGLPIQVDHLPIRPIKGRTLKPYLTEKHHLTLWISQTSWKKTRAGAEYPVITVINQKHGKTTHVYSGYDLLKRFIDENRRADSVPYTPSVPAKAPSVPAKAPKHDDMQKSQQWLDTVASWFKSSQPAQPDHGYLVSKGLSQYAPMLREKTANGTRWLVIPLSDNQGNIKAYQVINEQGKKLYAGSSKGLFYLVEGNLSGKAKTPKELLLCEGLATGLSLHAGNPDRWVAVCLDAGNLSTAAAAVKRKYPKSKLCFCADNDHRVTHKSDTLPHNVGLQAATYAASKYKSARVYLSPLIDGLKADFNDYAQHAGAITDDTLSLCEVPIVTPAYAKKPKDFNQFCTLLTHCVKYLSRADIKSQFIPHLLKTNFTQEKLAAINAVSPLLATEWQAVYERDQLRIDATLSEWFKPSLNYESCYQYHANYLPDISLKIGTPDAPAVTLLRSPLGSGKTTQLKSFVDYCKRLGMRIVYVLPRRILARFISSDLGLTDYQDDVVDIPKEHDHLAIVINSMPLLGVNDKREIVIFDECEQNLRQIESSLIKDKKELITSLDNTFNNASAIILTDAHLSRVSENFINAAMKRLNKNPRYYRYDNDFKRFEGRKMRMYDTYERLLDKCIQAAKDGQKIYIPTNGFKSSYQIKKALLAVNPELRIKVVNSDNSHTQDEIDFVSKINQQVFNYDVVIVSPSLTSGVSIDDKLGKHFDMTCGFFFSSDQTSGPLDAAQQLARVRYADNVHVWYEKKLYNKPIKRAELINQIDQLQQYLHLECCEDGQLYASELHPYAALYADVKGIENAFLNNGLESFKWLAEKDGWQIVEAVEGDHETGKLARADAKQSFINQEIEGILQADIISKKQAFELDTSDSLTRDQRWQLDRHKLEDFYSDVVSHKLIEDDKGGATRAAVKLREIVGANPDDLRTILKHDYTKAAEQWAELHIKPLPLLQMFYKVVLGAYQTDNPNGVSKDCEQVKNAVTWIRQNSRLLQAAGLDTDIKSPMAYLGYQVEKLGYRRAVKRVGADKVRFYSLVSCEVVEATVLKRADNGKNHIQQIIKGLTDNHTNHKDSTYSESVALQNNTNHTNHKDSIYSESVALQNPANYAEYGNEWADHFTALKAAGLLGYA
jgi:hypothetical protein